jgi:phospholipid-binding lipoprotein MlaA
MTVNDTSLVIGEYEDLKESALDPYVALRNAYHQYRRSKIEE